MAITILSWLLGLGLVLLIGRWLALRLQLSRAKHRSLAGHVRWGRRLARLIPYYEYDETQFFRADDAPEEIAQQRRAAFSRLAALYAQRFVKTVRQTNEVQDEISDLQFTARYRVPFQFSRLVRPASEQRGFCCLFEWARHHRSGRKPAVRPDRLLWGQCLWL